MSDTANILLLAFFGSIVALIGGVIFLVKKSWSSWLSAYSVPFAAGVLLTVSFLGILPEAIHLQGDSALFWTLIAFLTAYLFEHFLFGIHHHENTAQASRYQSAIPLVVIGDTIHNFVDGVTIAAAYLINPGLGVITTVSTFLHEVPHEIGDFGIMLKAGWRRKSILIVNILSASTTLIGALLLLFVIRDSQLNGVLLSVAAGLFIYLGATDFLPHIHEGKISNTKAVISLLLGVIIMLATISLIPHTHEQQPDHHPTYEAQPLPATP